jgi:hypothetical protein
MGPLGTGSHGSVGLGRGATPSKARHRLFGKERCVCEGTPVSWDREASGVHATGTIKVRATGKSDHKRGLRAQAVRKGLWFTWQKRKE